MFIATSAMAQDNVYPAPPQSETIALVNGTIHVGNGQVIEKGTIVFEKGKITAVGANATAPAGAKVIDVSGKKVYPGLILSSTNLGLVEVNSIKATQDESEFGTYNTNVRSIVAYNTDSRVINTLRNSGILQASITPAGATISGSSSVVQLDAWHWEDAAIAMDNGLHLRMPNLLIRRGGRGGFPMGMQQANVDPVQQGLRRIEEIKVFFREAQAYFNEAKPAEKNLAFEATRKLFKKEQKLFIHCNIVKEMLIAVDIAKEFNLDVVIVGGSDSYLIADILKENNIAVILHESHSLPTLADDDVAQPYKTPALLQKAGVLFSINDTHANSRYRNLAYNAGTAAAYGLTKEEALSAVTLNAAKILGVDKITGSLEVGKDATIVVSEGDILDMRTNIITNAFIQGRTVDLDDKSKQLNERYKHKYNIK